MKWLQKKAWWNQERKANDINPITVVVHKFKNIHAKVGLSYLANKQMQFSFLLSILEMFALRTELETNFHPVCLSVGSF